LLLKALPYHASLSPLLPLASGLPDLRLQQRLHTLIDTFSQQPQRSVPHSTGNRNDMDAAYNFFKNPRVQPGAIVHCCLPETVQQLSGCPRVLAIQDTSDLNYSSLSATTGRGHTDGPGGRGLELHSTLAVRADGLPGGLLTQQSWARDSQDKGRVKDRRRHAAADKESFRWQDQERAARAVLPEDVTVIHVADREGDIYAWLAAPRAANSHLLVRVAQAQRVVVQTATQTVGSLAEVVRAAPVLGQHTIDVPRADGQAERTAVLTLRLAAVEVQPPKHAQQRSQLRPVPVGVVEAYEEAAPAGTPAICWRLLTTEPLQTWEQGLRALQEYLWRWHIERFHYILKSGCPREQLQLSDADRLANAVAVYSQVAVRIQRLTYQARVEPQAAAESVFSGEELEVLQGVQQRQKRGQAAGPLRTVREVIRVLAQLGGDLGRKGDGPPGVKVLWRGLQCLHDLVLGYRIAQYRIGQETRLLPPRYP
jgi:hypothetical protein